MRYGASTRLSPDRALQKAKEFFEVPELPLKEESPGHVLLQGDLGYVQVKVTGGNDTEIEIETKGYDIKVKQFLQRVG